MTTTTAETAVRPRTTDGRIIATIGLLLVVSGLWLLADPLGAVGVALVGVWYLAPPIYTVGVGFVLATALAPDGITGVEFAPIGIGLLLMLVSTTLDEEQPGSIIVLYTASLSVLLVIVGGWLLWRETVAVAAGLLFASLAVGLYGGHRYSLVGLGLVEEAP